MSSSALPSSPSPADSAAPPSHRRTASNAVPAQSPGGFRRSVHGGQGRAGVLMASPAIVLLVLFLVIPVLLTLVLSMTNARLISPNPPEFIGVQNFVRALGEDPVLQRSLWNTLGFALVVVPVQAALALFLAVLINRRWRGITFLRTLIFLPVVTSMVVVSIVWSFLYREQGLINASLDLLTGGLFSGFTWLQDTSTAMPAIIILSIWQGVGFQMIIWLAGLQTIDRALYEAAAIDGASSWNQFRNVTWPGLRPTMIFVLVTISIAALGLFVQVDVMTGGGPLNSTSTIVYQAVQSGFRRQQIGYAAAISLLFFVLVLAISLAQRWLTRERPDKPYRSPLKHTATPTAQELSR